MSEKAGSKWFNRTDAGNSELFAPLLRDQLGFDDCLRKIEASR
jgi:hypothetical protein